LNTSEVYRYLTYLTVNENKTSFCAIVVDHALEHINRIMNVIRRLVGKRRMTLLVKDFS